MKVRHCLLASIAALAISPISGADVVTDWNNAVIEVIRNQPLNPLIATRTLAMVHVAIHDAGNGVDPHYQRYYVQGSAPPNSSVRAAMSQAAHRVLTSLYPDRADYFDDVLAKSLADIPRGAPKLKGRIWGYRVGTAILKLRENDNWDLVVPYEPSGELGRWQPTPPGFAPAAAPHWPFVTPWTMTSGSQFRVGAPPELATEEFAEWFNDVKDLGRVDSEVRTDEQAEIAFFWEDGGGSATPPGHWFIYAQDVARDQGYDLFETARLFALMALAQADALIAVWDSKYTYDYVRPVTNIQLEADIDGNPDTEADPAWMPALPTPPHPSYPSGHSGLSAATARILELYVGSASYHFCGASPDPDRWPDVLPGVVRCWDSFEAAAEEAGRSRIYGGIHWQFDNLPALQMGRDLATQTFVRFLRPL